MKRSTLAASIIGVDADELDRRMKERRLARLRAEAEEAERLEEEEEEEELARAQAVSA